MKGRQRSEKGKTHFRRSTDAREADPIGNTSRQSLQWWLCAKMKQVDPPEAIRIPLPSSAPTTHPVSETEDLPPDRTSDDISNATMRHPHNSIPGLTLPRYIPRDVGV